MKKTLTINLGGIVYHIDDDAYRLLDNYLSNLKHYFRKQEGAEEIVNDIEMRIAELFAEKVTEGKQVITVSDVEEIIARVGKPEDFGIADEDMDSQKRTEQTSSSTIPRCFLHAYTEIRKKQVRVSKCSCCAS